jgi:MFS family permease
VNTFTQLMRRVFGFDYADHTPLPKSTRRGLTYFYWDAVFALFSDASSANYVNLFLVSLKASNTQIGFLATLVQVLTALAPLPGAAIAERSGRYRMNILAPAFIARMGWFALALLPFLPLGPAAVVASIAIFGTRAFMMAWLSAPWTAFVGRMVPAHVRASYMATRNFGGGLATIAGTLLAGQVISAFGAPTGYQVVFVMSGIAGLAAQWMFSRIPFADGVSAKRTPDDGLLKILRGMRTMLREHPQYARILLCNCALALAVGIGGPFIQVYQVRELGFAAGAIGLLASIELATNITMQRVYGSVVIPRFGELKVMRVLRPLTSLIPFAWLFATTPAMGIPIVVLAGMLWSGHELSSFNTLLTITPEDGRANYIALHMFAVSLSAAIGPALGGALVDTIGFFPLFITSAALRLGAGVLLNIVAARSDSLTAASHSS